MGIAFAKHGMLSPETLVFIDMHLNRATSNDLNHHHLIKHFDQKVNRFYLFPNESLGGRPQNVMLSLQLHGAAFKVLGPCNGILCLRGSGVSKKKYFHIILWNPTTREYKVLPTSNFGFPPYKLGRECYIGYGFDHKTKDCKVVQLLGFRRRNDRKKDEVRAKVYSFNADSWRPIHVKLPYFTTRYRGCTLYVNGEIHWSGFCEGDPIILSFDIGSEERRVTPIPVYSERENNTLSKYYDRDDHTLSMLDGSLAVIFFSLGWWVNRLKFGRWRRLERADNLGLANSLLIHFHILIVRWDFGTTTSCFYTTNFDVPEES
ncbi:unnamed protein product [Ilex paraguariensis]|uniref:F-box associated beta-propeller type 1 domain-containing protein n=2 Tax=Ilex paraguariensis TaxID=185542 RepID=A0ABC8UYR7_9AQUA